ncbi:Y-box factor [Biomphalaria glabrata]|nr:Y-box factor [Biomphalaria glabrata]
MSFFQYCILRIWNIPPVVRIWNIPPVVRIWNIPPVVRIWNIPPVVRIWNIPPVVRIWNIPPVVRIWNIPPVVRILVPACFQPQTDFQCRPWQMVIAVSWYYKKKKHYILRSFPYHDLNLIDLVDQGSQRPTPTPRAIVKYQAYNSDSTPAESQACVPNTGEEHHTENSISRQNNRTMTPI